MEALTREVEVEVEVDQIMRVPLVEAALEVLEL